MAKHNFFRRQTYYFQSNIIIICLFLMLTLYIKGHTCFHIHISDSPQKKHASIDGSAFQMKKTKSPLMNPAGRYRTLLFRPSKARQGEAGQLDEGENSTLCQFTCSQHATSLS